MIIKRTLDTTKATYDIKGLSAKQFIMLQISYEKEWYISRNKHPEKGEDELLEKLIAMRENVTLII